MPQFAYRALNASGRQVRGKLSANNESDLFQQLQAAVEAMHGSLFQQAGYLFMHADKGLARATWGDWVPTFALSAEGLLFAILFAAIVWILFQALWWLFALIADSLAASRRALPAAAETAAVEQIVASEVDHFLGWLRGTDIAPTVAALRTRADDVVSAELRRLWSKRPDFTDEQRGDVSRTLHRVVQQLLHSPTVRVRQLAAEPGGDQYATLLRELFDLDVPHATQADAVPEIGGKA